MGSVSKTSRVGLRVARPLLIVSVVVLAAGCDGADGRASDPATTTVTSADAVAVDSAGATTAGVPASPSAPSSAPPDDGERESEDDTAKEEPVEAVSPSELRPGEVDDGTAAELVEPLVDTSARLLADPSALDSDGLATLVAGEAMRQARATAQEYADLGWHQVGTPLVASASLVSLDADARPARARVEACLDHSAVDVVDAEGVSRVDPSAPRRVLNIFDLERRDGAWVVVDRTLPVDTDC